jgi:hypothetical protein
MEFQNTPGAVSLSGSYKHDNDDAKAYRAFRTYVRDAMRGRESDKEVMGELERSNADLLSLRTIRPGNVHVDQVLQNLSVMYANNELIADQISPTVFTGGKLSGTYFTYDKDGKLSYPDDTAADRTDLAELNESRSTATFSLTGRGFKEFVDQLTIQNQDAVLDELMDATENVLYALKFKKEQRAVTLFETTGSYGATATISSGTTRWNNATTGGIYTDGNPIGDVATGIDSLWLGNSPVKKIGVTSLAVYNVLRRHNQIVDAIKYGGSVDSPGIATKRAIAQILGLDDLVIGAARYNTAQEGQTSSYSRLWGNGFNIIAVADSPSRRSASFSYTFQDAPTQSDQMWMLEKGMKGGYMCRSSQCDQTKIVASLAGYRIITPIG